MVLAAGGTEGGPDNKHNGADQWLIVTEGTGAAIINGRKLSLKAGTMVLIEAGDRHEIRNTGRGLLKTVNVYLPRPMTARAKNYRRGRGDRWVRQTPNGARCQAVARRSGREPKKAVAGKSE